MSIESVKYDYFMSMQIVFNGTIGEGSFIQMYDSSNLLLDITKSSDNGFSMFETKPEFHGSSEPSIAVLNLFSDPNQLKTLPT